MSLFYTQQQTDRFWNNVEVGEIDACWPWKRSIHSGGYGQVSVRINGEDRVLKTHKVAWELRNNKLLGRDVRATHSCENRACCNPHHVVIHDFVDTPNAVARGEKHGRSKLTERQVKLIRYKLNALTLREIATCFGVGYQTIWDIRKGITWRHV